MEPLHTAPEASSFVLLAEHQSRTPASFYSGPPVLHYHSKRCKVVILERDLLAVPALKAIRDGNVSSSTATVATSTDAGGAVTVNSAGVNGSEESSLNNTNAGGREVVIDGVDVWVTSDKFLVYAPSASAGVSIPYPSILLHAIQRLRLPDGSYQGQGGDGGDGDGAGAGAAEVQGLYMQIATPPSVRVLDQESGGMEMQMDEDEDEEASISMTIVPPPSPPSTSLEDEGSTARAPAQEDADADANLLSETKPGEEETPTQMFYAALSACSNLHPDPVEPGEESEGGGGGIGTGIIRGSGLFGSALFQAGLISGGAGDGNGNGLPPPVEGGSGWITAENMHEYFDEDGNWIGPSSTAGSVPLGPGAGTVRRREEEEEDAGQVRAGGDGVNGDGTDGGLNEETKWRRTD